MSKKWNVGGASERTVGKREKEGGQVGNRCQREDVGVWAASGAPLQEGGCGVSGPRVKCIRGGHATRTSGACVRSGAVSSGRRCQRRVGVEWRPLPEAARVSLGREWEALVCVARKLSGHPLYNYTARTSLLISLVWPRLSVAFPPAVASLAATVFVSL